MGAAAVQHWRSGAAANEQVGMKSVLLDGGRGSSVALCFMSSVTLPPCSALDLKQLEYMLK